MRSRKLQWGLMFLIVWAAASESAYAGRPLAIDDADPVEQGLAEIELGLGYVHDPDVKHWDYPAALSAGVLSGIEIGFGFGGQIEERAELLESGASRRSYKDGIGDVVVGAKWQFYGGQSWFGRQALVPSVKFPTASEDNEFGSGETDCDLTWILSRSVTDRISGHVNAGYSWIGRPEDEDLNDVIHCGVALDYQLTEPVQLVGEVFAENERADEAETVVQFNVGLRWAAAESLIIDIAAGSGISADTPEYFVTAGVTWTVEVFNS